MEKRWFSLITAPRDVLDISSQLVTPLSFMELTVYVATRYEWEYCDWSKSSDHVVSQFVFHAKLASIMRFYPGENVLIGFAKK